ncbi:MAG TPA: hypothetical protein VGR43_01020, partial [Dehalococcoidia bacterium]|nr:hypothetical protein [Dehalococcoidia bacterium]
MNALAAARAVYPIGVTPTSKVGTTSTSAAPPTRAELEARYYRTVVDALNTHGSLAIFKKADLPGQYVTILRMEDAAMMS